MKEILIGADPEVFVRREGVLLPAHGMVLGTKTKPQPVAHGAVQVDGLALEFNIDPARNADEFVENIHIVQQQLAAMVPGCELVMEPVAVFDKALYDACPPEAKMLGCDPDYNAWTMEENPAPPNETTMRTASGHIHIGWTKDKNPFDAKHFSDCAAVARQMDYVLGIYSLWWDKDNRRRQMYGRAGAFRPKPYGCEYRVMSNVWLRDERLMRFIHRGVMFGMNKLFKGQDFTKIFGDFPVSAIDSGLADWKKTEKGSEVYSSTFHTNVTITG